MLVIARCSASARTFKDFSAGPTTWSRSSAAWATAFIDPTSLMGVFRYFADLLDARRAGSAGDDLVGLLLQSEGDGGSTLTGFEIAGFCMLLLVAGNETTTSLLGNTIAALLDQPDELDRLRNDVPSCRPRSRSRCATTALPGLVPADERAEVELGRSHHTAGRGRGAALRPANRDDRHYADPDHFDVARTPPIISASVRGHPPLPRRAAGPPRGRGGAAFAARAQPRLRAVACGRRPHELARAAVGSSLPLYVVPAQ